MKGVQSMVGVALVLAAGSAGAAEPLKLNIFVEPSDGLVQVVDTATKDFEAVGLKTFHARGYPVHATLYLTHFKADALSDIFKEVEELADRWESLPMSVKGMTISKGNWVMLNVPVTAKLQRLADEATLALEPYRDQDIAPPEWVKDYPNKLAAVQRYGSPNVFVNFQPHLTLMAPPKDLAALTTYKQKHPTPAYAGQGQARAIGVGVADEWGQVKQVLALYPLATGEKE